MTVRRDSLLDVGGELARPGACLRRGPGAARDAAANGLAGPAYGHATHEMAGAVMAGLLQTHEANPRGRRLCGRM